MKMRIYLFLVTVTACSMCNSQPSELIVSITNGCENGVPKASEKNKCEETCGGRGFTLKNENVSCSESELMCTCKQNQKE